MASPRSNGVRVQITRDLGLFDVTMAGVGAMLGAGIFVLAGSAARVAGSAAWLALPLSAFVALLTAFAYAELASNRPSPGGGYAWVSEALPPPSGFLSGWLTWAGHIAAAALSSLGIAVIVDYALESAGITFLGLPRNVVLGGVPYNLSEKAIGAFVLMGFLALRAVAPTGAFRPLGYFSLLKFLLLAAFVGAATATMFSVPNLLGRFAVTTSQLPVLPLAAGVVFITYQGFEVVAQRSEHVKNPERTLPRGIFLALGLAALLYTTFEIVLLGNVTDAPYCGGSAAACLAAGPRAPGATEPELGFLFAAASIGPAAVGFLFATAIASMASGLVSNMDSGTRTAVSMAREGTLPTTLSHVTERRIPAVGLAVSGAIAGVLLFAFNIEQLAVAAASLFLMQ